MFHHVKELQFDARVSAPDPRFANLLMEQFGGANGELKAALQYFLQAFSARKPYPDKYDMLMDIATEEFTHLEIVYEYLLLFTDDPHIKDTLRFLMTREIAHFQMFWAALESIKPNFPPGVLQGDPRFTHAYYNMSDGKEDKRGPWNQGQGPWGSGEEWDYIEDPVSYVHQTHGQKDRPIRGSKHTQDEIDKKNRELSQMRSQEVKKCIPSGEVCWSSYEG